MKFEDYVKEELEKIDKKIDSNSNKIESLMIFMAVQKAEDSKKTKYVSGIISLVVSLIAMSIGKFL